MNDQHTTTVRRGAGWARPVLGTAGLLIGVFLFCAGLLAESGADLPFAMPRTWYINRPLWYFFATVCLAAGCYLLKARGRSEEPWRATRPGVRFRRLVLYTRTDCHLCDQAKTTLLEHGDYLPPVTEINVDSEPQLLRRFGTCVPVVECDGKIRFRGRLNESLLRRLIEGTPPLREKPR